MTYIHNHEELLLLQWLILSHLVVSVVHSSPTILCGYKTILAFIIFCKRNCFYKYNNKTRMWKWTNKKITICAYSDINSSPTEMISIKSKSCIMVVTNTFVITICHFFFSWMINLSRSKKFELVVSRLSKPYNLPTIFPNQHCL